MALFAKDDLRGMSWGDSDLKVIETEIIDQGRWLTHKRAVFQDANGDFYETYYSVGSTESQDYTPYEDEGDYIECKQVFPTKKEIVIYV